MNRLKLWYYPNGYTPIHDAAGYPNCVPFCEAGWKKWVDWVSVDEAEFFWCGQIPDFVPNPFDISVFPMLKDCPERHIVDLEGDYRPGTFRTEFAGCIRMASGAPLAWRNKMVFPRPTLSMMLQQIVREDQHFDDWPKPHTKTWFFRGKPDAAGVRLKMREACHAAGLLGVVRMVPQWNGPAPVGSAVHQAFKLILRESAVALCPQGEGVATARFYEACAMGRFPVIIGETLVLGGEHDFYASIPAELSVAEMAIELNRINQMPLSEMIARGQAAKHYFDTVVRPYFADPTAAFITWLRARAKLTCPT